MPHNVLFKRKFSVNLYKSKRLLLSEMKFGFLPLKTERGDLYPRLAQTGSFSEACENGQYVFLPENGCASAAHLIGGFNPYSTYEVAPSHLSEGAKAGVAVFLPENRLLAYARLEDGHAAFYMEWAGKTVKTGETPYEADMRFLFTFHAGIYAEMYAETNGVIRHIGDAVFSELRFLRSESVFSNADAALYVEGESRVAIREVKNYLDSGIMQADIKPVKYENGEVLTENGKMFFTFTSRFETEMMQQVMSYRLNTGEIKLEGALLFDSGNGEWCADVASTLIYDRNAKIWRIWMCVFSNGHVLAYGQTEADPRFGINVMDVTPLAPVESEYAFGGRTGDEDPDLYFDENEKTWYLSICRNDPASGKYRYYLFSSKRPDGGYSFVSRTEESLETTGGSFVRVKGKIFFVFGRSFSEMSRYDVCEFPSLKKLGELQSDHPDGGFRGWGSIAEIPCGTRRRLLWATFDRMRGSGYNWSYGNLYFFESNTFISGE